MTPHMDAVATTVSKILLDTADTPISHSELCKTIASAVISLLGAGSQPIAPPTNATPYELRRLISAAFWSEGRQAFIACTSDDVERRSGVTAGRAIKTLAAMKRAGLAISDSNHSTHIYELTPKGQAAYRTMCLVESE